MKRSWIMLLASVLVGLGSFGLVQDDSGERDHGDHESQSEVDHDDMDHSEHGAVSAKNALGEPLNVVLVGDASLTLEPLISADGAFTLGVRVEPPADLSLSVTSPSGQDVALNAVAITAKMDDMQDEAEEGHADEHQEGEDPSGEMGDGEHGDMTDEHSAEDKDADHNDTDDSEHDMDTTAAVRQTLAFQVGAAEAGVWRFSGTVGGADVSFPISLYNLSEDGTDVYLTLAPSPSLSTRGLSESFIYAFKDGEPVHSGMMVNRAMAGMQHSTDDEQLDLVHNHFNDVYNDTLGYGPMANQSPLGFAMAGTWDVTVTVMGSNMKTFAFDVEVLDE